jgi:6-phosphofructokinase
MVVEELGRASGYFAVMSAVAGGHIVMVSELETHPDRRLVLQAAR